MKIKFDDGAEVEKQPGETWFAKFEEVGPPALTCFKSFRVAESDDSMICATLMSHPWHRGKGVHYSMDKYFVGRHDIKRGRELWLGEGVYACSREEFEAAVAEFQAQFRSLCEGEGESHA